MRKSKTHYEQVSLKALKMRMQRRLNAKKKLEIESLVVAAPTTKRGPFDVRTAAALAANWR